MRFRSRADAADKLVKTLTRFTDNKVGIVIALPRGGVVLGRVIADALRLPLDIVVPRKIGAQENEEYAIGAMTEAGDVVWNEVERRLASQDYLTRIVAEERAEALRRLAVYRLKGAPRDLTGKTVLVVDDGIATGFTMRAAIATIKREGAAHIIVAIPVCPPDVKEILEHEVDEVIALEQPQGLGSIGAYYDAFPQVEDEEVIGLLQKHTV